MSAVIQGRFPAGRPLGVAMATAAAAAAGPRFAPGPPRPAGPPPPAHVGPSVAQRRGDRHSWAVDAGRLNLHAPGQKLPAAVRAHMEVALGADFGDVTVHVGPQAPALGALAFTMGSKIFFAPGQFDPGSPRGRELLGHELAHVVQQRQGRVRVEGAGLVVVDDRMLEIEADRLARLAVAAPVPRRRTPPPTHRPPTQRALPALRRAAVVQRMIWYEAHIPEFQIDGQKPSWRGAVKQIALAASQNRNHRIDYATIENDGAILLNSYLSAHGAAAKATAWNEVKKLTKALFTKHTRSSKRQDYVDAKNALANLKVSIDNGHNNIEKRARQWMSCLNSSEDNVRAADATLNSTIGPNLDMNFNPGVQNIGGHDYLTLTPISNEIGWSYLHATTLDPGFVQDPTTSHPLASDIGPTGGVPGTSYPVRITDQYGSYMDFT